MSSLKKVFSYSDNGPFLNINEDDMAIDIKESLFAVIDGHGGSGIGDQGSTLIRETLIENYGNLVSDPDATMPIFYDPDSSLEVNALMNVLMLSNSNLMKSNEAKDYSKRAGVSLIAGVAIESTLHCVSVGSCFGLKINDKNLAPIFLPDSNYIFSMMQQTQEGQVFPYSFLGEKENFNYQVKSIEVELGEKVLLMTDGIYQRISGLEFLSIYQAAQGNTEELVNQLLALANDRGNKDNQSIIVLEY